MDFRLWLLVFSTTALAGDFYEFVPGASNAPYVALSSDEDRNLDIEVPSVLFENDSFAFDRFLTSSPLTLSFGDPQVDNVPRRQNEPNEYVDSFPHGYNERKEKLYFDARNEKNPCDNVSIGKDVIKYVPNVPIVSDSMAPSDEDHTETECSSFEDYDSSSDFGLRTKSKRKKSIKSNTKVVSKKLKLAPPAFNSGGKGRDLTKIDIKPSTATKPIAATTDVAIQKSTPKRTSYCNRTPFIYRTRCNCNNNSFSYVGAAVRHQDSIHASSMKDCTIDYRKYIELIDDFGILANYPIRCKLCPFRTAKQSYLALHDLNVHQK